MNPLQPLIDHFLNHPGQLVWVFVIGSAALRFLGSINKSISETRKNAEAEAERHRQGTQAALERRERDPNTQSYQGYLGRTQADQLEQGKDSELFGRNKPTANPSSALNTLAGDASASQDRLREAMARKMSQIPRGSSDTSTPAKPSPLTDLLKELFSDDTRSGQPNAQPPMTLPKQRKPTNAPRPARADFKPTLMTSSLRIDPGSSDETSKLAKIESPIDVLKVREVGTVREVGAAKPMPLGGNRPLFWSRDELLRSVIVSEVLGPPKSRRRS